MATIIKNVGPSGGRDGASFKFEELTERATEYLDQARRQAAEILAQAETDATAIRRQAEEQGRAAALEAAERILEEKVGRQIATLAPALHEVVDSIHSERAGWLAHWEKSAVHVALAVAARIIRREVAQQPQITLALVKEALELAAGRGEIVVRLHPADHQTLGPQVQQLTSELSRLGDVQIVADSQITAGGCRVDTRYGVIDQQLEAQLTRIEQELS